MEYFVVTCLRRKLNRLDENTDAKQVIELLGQDVWDKLIELSKATGKTPEIVVSFMICQSFICQSIIKF